MESTTHKQIDPPKIMQFGEGMKMLNVNLLLLKKKNKSLLKSKENNENSINYRNE